MPSERLTPLSKNRFTRRAALLAFLLVLGGCSRQPKAVKHPLADGATCAAEAMALYDKNGDGQLDESELRASPGLQAALERVDANRDNAVSADEIAGRIDALRGSSALLMTAVVALRRGSAPLSGVQVVVEPEPFLKNLPVPVAGVTGPRGELSLARPDADLPGIYSGMYRVRVSNPRQGKETIPANYNSETTLGFELAGDLPVRDKIEFDLKP